MALTSNHTWAAGLYFATKHQLSIRVDKDITVINKWSKLYPGLCEFVQVDASEFLSHYEYDGNELIYADPPYLCSTRRQSKVYTFEYSDDDHIRLLAVLQSLSCMVLISGYDNEIYNDLLSGWRKVSFQAKTWTDVREECVWLNFKSPSNLHDTRHLGANFRERQTIK